MPRTPQPSEPDRRRFLKTLGIAGLSSALIPSSLSFAQTPTSGPAAATPDSATTPAAPAPPEISEDARSLAEIVRRRYGQHLSPEQLEAVTRELNGRLQGGRRLRETRLTNADEPDFTFHV